MSTGSERHAKIVDKVNNFEVRVHISLFTVQLRLHVYSRYRQTKIHGSFTYKGIQYVIQHI